jgi:hypothetical protein
MYTLFEELPDTVEVDGSFYKVKTDFRDMLRLIEMCSSDESEQVKNDSLYLWYVDDYPYSVEKQAKGLIDFLQMKDFVYKREVPKEVKEKDISPPSQRSVIDYKIDAPLIYSAFRQVYGINIANQKELDKNPIHWYEFRMLIDGLPDSCPLKERMNYRAIDVNSIKDKDEKKRITKIQLQIALPQAELKDEDIGNAFSAFM